MCTTNLVRQPLYRSGLIANSEIVISIWLPSTSQNTSRHYLLSQASDEQTHFYSVGAVCINETNPTQPTQAIICRTDKPSLERPAAAPLLQAGRAEWPELAHDGLMTKLTRKVTHGKHKGQTFEAQPRCHSA